MTSEEKYINKRKRQAFFLGLRFYLMRVFPIDKKKIVVSTFEGDGGYCCNPRYIVEELIKENKGYKIVWLTHDPNKHSFPKEIVPVTDTPWKTAYHLSTAKVWIDNYRKPFGTKKRKGQLYIQTWHASLGFKAVGLFRGDKFPKIARIVSEYDSNLADYFVSNSDYLTGIFPKKLLYNGPVLQYGSPRCDCIVKEQVKLHKAIREEFNLAADAKIVIFAPTFRGGNQKGKKEVVSEMPTIDFAKTCDALKSKFGGDWYVMLRLHPQLSAKLDEMPIDHKANNIIDVSQYEDISQLIGACDALITDYSSCAFDAAFGKIPVFLYADDVQEYIENRGQFMWEKDELPFSVAETNDELIQNVCSYSREKYLENIDSFALEHGIDENGNASKKIADVIVNNIFLSK